MKNFTFRNPTKIIFGEGTITKLSRELQNYGKNILLCYGGGSIKANGIYDSVIKELKLADKNVIELAGITPNPRTDKVDEGIELCKKYHIDFILAVGGGSTIDCAKAIAAAACLAEDQNYWEILFEKGQSVDEAIPLGAVLTMAATGSEMNSGAVITNVELKRKYGMHTDAVFPQFSILDPTYTYSLPRNQVVYGVADMLSHLMETYFSLPDESNVTDDLIESLMKTIINNTLIAIDNLEDYTARSNLMWAATLALNGLTTLGKSGDWMSHNIEHSLSAFYDIPHGAGLAIVHPMLLQYVHKNHIPRFVRFAKNVWNIDSTGKSDEELAQAGIDALRQFLHKIGCPITLKEVGIPTEALPEIAASTRIFATSYHNFTTDDILKIYQSALD